MARLAGILVFLVLVVLANLAAQRVPPTLRGDDVGRRIGYRLVVRAVVAGIVLAGVGIAVLFDVRF